MSVQGFILNVNGTLSQTTKETKTTKEKVMSYEEKSVGSTAFFKCEACPYMALAEDDIKFHLFTVHTELAKSNGLADNIRIPCPGCTSVFDAEETLRTHLRNHHKMGIKDVKKMVKSLVQIALKNAKLKKEVLNNDPPAAEPVAQNVADLKIPQVIEIEILPDAVSANNNLPKGVGFISVDELNKMSTPNFEKVDPKEIIQDASFNIVYNNEIAPQYISVSGATTVNTSCNMIQVSSVTPDLISSVQPQGTTVASKPSSSPQKEMESSHIPFLLKSDQMSKEVDTSELTLEEKYGKLCSINGCRVRLKDDDNLTCHRKCHKNGSLICLECNSELGTVESLHTHLWKVHSVDMELPTCDTCGFKTYNRHRLFNIHMNIHRKIKAHICTICSKSFKNANQLSKHKLVHKRTSAPVQCSICQREFNNQRRMLMHVSEVHDRVKPFKCLHCNYTSARKDQLKMHIRSHTGDKPYECTQCNFRTGDHNSLRRHKKQHSNESVYKCKHCPYTAIQSTVFTSHMISKHPNITASDVHRCPYCPFKTVNKDKYVLHLTTHPDKEGIQLLIELTKNKANKQLAWTIPSENSSSESSRNVEQTKESSPKTVNEIPIEVYDCDSLSESLPPDFVKSFCATSSNDTPQPSDINSQPSKEDNNSDCLMSESSNDTMMDRHQYPTQHLLSYDTNQSNLHFLNTSVSMEQSLLQHSNVNSLVSNHCSIQSSISNNIMNNFPIRLPPAPQKTLRNNITLKPVDKISMPNKVTGPIIRPTQILPVPSSCNSPVNIPMEPEGVPRKKPKISVKSNLILKGPDQVNMFHSQQKMAFRRLEDNERFGLGSPVTFNNLITTQFMQLQPEPSLSESPNIIMSYPQEPMLADTATTPVDAEMNTNAQIFSFNQQLNVNTMPMLPPPQKIQTNDPSYIKLESTIKQNTQSPSLERMCNANLLNNSTITREYKASPPLEDINKNMSEIKNEVKSDSFYNITMNNTAANQPIIEQYLLDNLIGEKYSGLMDLSGVAQQETPQEQNDVIEIDDNSDDNKLLPRLDMFYPLEGLYSLHNEFHFLDSETGCQQDDVNRMISELPIMNQKEVLLEGSSEGPANEIPVCIHSIMDPMMNAIRPTTNKINVKNIELMKN